MSNKDLIAELRSLVLKMRTGRLALIDESVLARAADALEAADGGWRLIRDGAPKDGTWVLLSPCWSSPDEVDIGKWAGKRPAGWRGLHGLPAFPRLPTHWKPLPQPPTDGEQPDVE